jgi:hypothetical protein
MKLIFKLSMPNCNSWNGKWSGEGDLYARVRSVGTSKAAIEKARKILDKGYFYYNFGDGWGAAVEVYECTSTKEKYSIEKRTRGFAGYEWMIDSILEWGAILNSEQEAERRRGRATAPSPAAPSPPADASSVPPEF